MKKIISVILVLTFAVSCAYSFTATVGADVAPTLTVVNPQTVTAGETFTVTVEMSNNPGIWSTKIFLYFDPELVCESVQTGDVFPAGSMTLANDLNRSCANNKVARAAFDSRNIAPQDYNSACVFFCNDDPNMDNDANGTLAVFTMRAPSEPGTYVIGVLDALGDVIDCNDTDIYFSYVNSTIEVEASSQVLIGDVDGDGAVGLKDLTLLKKYKAGSVDITNIVAENSDIDGDGTISLKDIPALRKLIAGGAA